MGCWRQCKDSWQRLSAALNRCDRSASHLGCQTSAAPIGATAQQINGALPSRWVGVTEFSVNGKKNNGGGGIRTHGGFHLAGFQDRSHQPLDHPSTQANLQRRSTFGFCHNQAKPAALKSLQSQARLIRQGGKVEVVAPAAHGCFEH